MQLILVHGYLAPALLMWPLGRRLQAAGHDFKLYGYPSRRPDFDGHAAELAAYVAGQTGPIALIGHSMGGLLIHRAVEHLPGADIAAQVFLATPHRGSEAVRRIGRVRGLRRLATGVRPGAFGVAPAVPRGLRAAIGGSRDKMVRLDEATLPDASPFLSLPFGHNELLLRDATARSIALFLETGRFD